MIWGLSERSVEEIYSIFKKYPVIKKVVLYGSRAKGNYREGSDVDLTLFGKGLDGVLSKINNDLDDSYLPYKFDVSIFDELSDPDFIDHIRRVGVTFYEKKC
jgi:predicted nucleotidyltransferase